MAQSGPRKVTSPPMPRYYRHVFLWLLEGNKFGGLAALATAMVVPPLLNLLNSASILRAWGRMVPALSIGPGPPGAATCPSRFASRIGFVWCVCMGAQGAQPPKSAVAGPGRSRAAAAALYVLHGTAIPAGRGVTLPRAALVTRGISYISVVIRIFVYLIRDSYEAERPAGG
jgi:hypothetical protein